MGRAPCCEKDSVKRGPWTPEEDAKLLACIAQHGTGSWRTLPKKAGLQRCGKSCRLRWTNYLRPDLKHGRFSEQEEQLIVKLHAALGSRWSLIAAQLPGRTDNDVKNYWNTRLKKKLCEMGIDPITHKPISQLLADLAGSITLPKSTEIAEATLGCFKDDMLNVLMRKRPEHQQQQHHIQRGESSSSAGIQLAPFFAAQYQSAWDQVVNISSASDRKPERTKGCSSLGAMQEGELFAQKIKIGLSSAVQSNPPFPLLPFMVSGPSDPVNCVKSTTSPFTQRMASMPTVVAGYHAFGETPKEGNSSALPDEDFSFGDETVSKSMLDMLLESSGGMASFCPNPPTSGPATSDRGLSSTSLHQFIGASNPPASISATSPLGVNISQKLIDSVPQQQIYTAFLQQQERNSGLTHAINSMSINGHVCNVGLCENSRETVAWSPSCSASSSNNTNVAAPEAPSMKRVPSSDALQLWDLSELGSMIS